MLYRRPSLLRVLREHTLTGRVELGIAIRTLLADRRRGPFRMRVHHDERRATERRPTRQQLISDES